MLKHIFLLLSLSVSLAFFACKEQKPTAPPAPVLTTVNMSNLTARECVKDSLCATIKIQFPTLSDGQNTAAINAINDSLRALVLAGLEANPKLTVEQAVDSLKIGLFAMLQDQMKMMPDWSGDFFKELETKALLNNSKFISFEIESSGFTGGAHPYYSAVFATYDLATGKSVDLTHVVKDTAALRLMLEKGFVDAKKEGQPNVKLSDLLFPEIQRLPVTTNVCIVPEGLRFFYNPYEVASWAVGPTEITLTWEQLGRLADRKKWVD